MQNSTLEIKEKLKKIKIVVSDVDGVLTDGRIYLGGVEEIKVFNTKDAMRIEAAARYGLPMVWLTGRKCSAVIQRAGELGVRLLFKKDVSLMNIPFLEFMHNEFGVSAEEILYIGDDWGDLYLMSQVGVAVTPHNGSRENKEVAHIITDAAGGDGAVAEMFEIVMRAQGTWDKAVGQYKNDFLF